MLHVENKTPKSIIKLLTKAFTVFTLIHFILMIKWQTEPVDEPIVEVTEREKIALDTLNIVKPRLTVHRKTSNKELSSMAATFNKDRPLAFIHVGKSGGTSMDAIFKHAAELIHFKYVGFKHFDYEYVNRHFHGTAQASVLNQRDLKDTN